MNITKLVRHNQIANLNYVLLVPEPQEATQSSPRIAVPRYLEQRNGTLAFLGRVCNTEAVCTNPHQDTI
ncbi:hypothetical protein RRF57_000102 [Xylaria bambusicola]|uniref:Uncharacterized protein n=1 Tax=Xylaria bambusicola TaxID=326684 RepID=A0AAN7UCB2_9PEZI